jgi:hypothetical protein
MESQALMHADCPTDFFVDIRFQQLRPPIPMIGTDKAGDSDVVE